MTGPMTKMTMISVKEKLTKASKRRFANNSRLSVLPASFRSCVSVRKRFCQVSIDKAQSAFRKRVNEKVRTRVGEPK